MARRTINKKKKAAPVQVYRHFAVVTIAATLILAVFADGEKRDAIAAEVQHQVDQNTQQNKKMAAGLVDNRASSPGSFGSDDGGDFGAPMDGGGSDGGSGIDPSMDFGSGGGSGSGMPTGYNIYGVSNEEWAKMTDDQKKEIIARYQAEQKAAASDERQEQITNLLAQSRARSGG